MSGTQNPPIYGSISGAVLPSTTIMRITVKWYTSPSNGSQIMSDQHYDYDLRDRSVTDDYIEADLRRHAEIIADGLRRKQEIDQRIGAIDGQRVRLA